MLTFNTKRGVVGSYISAMPTYLLVLVLMTLFLIITGVFVDKPSDLIKAEGYRNEFSFGSGQRILFMPFAIQGALYTFVEFGIESLDYDQAFRAGFSMMDESKIDEIALFMEDGQRALQEALAASYNGKEPICTAFTIGIGPGTDFASEMHRLSGAPNQSVQSGHIPLYHAYRLQEGVAEQLSSSQLQTIGRELPVRSLHVPEKNAYIYYYYGVCPT